MIGFQAAGAAPIFHNRIISEPETIASAIRIGNPASWKQARAAIDESGGAVDVVTDEEILDAQSWLARNEGFLLSRPARLRLPDCSTTRPEDSGTKPNRLHCDWTWPERS